MNYFLDFGASVYVSSKLRAIKKKSQAICKEVHEIGAAEHGLISTESLDTIKRRAYDIIAQAEYIKKYARAESAHRRK